MKKMKRVKIIREVLEAKIEKNARRIQSLSEQSFEFRKLLEAANRIEKQKPYVKDEEPKEVAKETGLQFENKPTTEEQIQAVSEKVVAEGTDALS